MTNRPRPPRPHEARAAAVVTAETGITFVWHDGEIDYWNEDGTVALEATQLTIQALHDKRRDRIIDERLKRFWFVDADVTPDAGPAQSPRFRGRDTTRLVNLLVEFERSGITGASERDVIYNSGAFLIQEPQQSLFKLLGMWPPKLTVTSIELSDNKPGGVNLGLAFGYGYSLDGNAVPNYLEEQLPISRTLRKHFAKVQRARAQRRILYITSVGSALSGLREHVGVSYLPNRRLNLNDDAPFELWVDAAPRLWRYEHPDATSWSLTERAH